jgi:S-adenosylmethionine:tRNA ribosyltransferase-isomerase
MDVRDFDFDLPAELIAQEPPPDRGGSRLLVLDRDRGSLTHTHVSALPDLLRAGDLLVVNDTRVFPARLLGRRVPSGGAVECLLIRSLSDADQVDVRSRSDPDQVDVRSQSDPDQVDVRSRSDALWEALVHPGQKLKPGARVVFEGIHTLHGEVLERRFFGRRLVRLWTEDGTTVDAAVDAIGHVPLPPYIKRDDRLDDRDRYQTVFARARGSIAAPTAGLHSNPPLVAALAARGVDTTAITLHVGYGTFQPVRVDRVEDHRLEPERYCIGAAAAAAIARARDRHHRIIAVGTTTTRTLEADAIAHGGGIEAGEGATDLFIYPGFEFRVVSGLLTNFHLPRSSLLMLVSAFAGRDAVMTAYNAAIAERYRFYSYGDAMLIL